MVLAVIASNQVLFKRTVRIRLALGVTKPAAMTNAITLQQWRPHPLAYFYFSIAVVLLGAVCSWGVVECSKRERFAEAAMAGAGLFAVVLWMSLRRCSTTTIPSFRGLLLITSYMTIGMGALTFLVVIPAVVSAMVAVIAIALVSLFRSDPIFAPRQFRQLIDFYRRHRMYQ